MVTAASVEAFVSPQCILMFAEPVESIHRFHRFFKRLFGRMPTSGRMSA